MSYNPDIHHRRSIRLKGYDYSKAGMYFVTICVQKHICLLGNVVDGEMVLNEYGQIVQMVWNELPQHYNNIKLNEFVIMPNHIHGIIVITDDDNDNTATIVRADNVRANDVRANDVCADTVGASFKPAPTPDHTPAHSQKHGLSEIVRALKTFSARKINELRNTRGEKLWQRNYWEHIICDEESYQRIANYIINNPINWQYDKFFAE